MKDNKVLTRSVVLIISIIGIILLLTLQYVWFRNAYKITEQNLREKCSTCLNKAVEKELIERINYAKTKKNNLTTEKGLPMTVSQSVNDPNDIVSTFQDIFILVGYDINVERIDTIFHELAFKELGFVPRYQLYITEDPVNKHVTYNINDTLVNELSVKKKLDLLPSNRKKYITNSISTNKPVFTRLNSFEMINLELLNPTADIIRDAKYILFISIILVILIAYIFIYQLRNTLRENRFARFIKEYTNALTHDLRSPLNSVNMAATMLHDETVPLSEQEKREYYRICKEQSRNLLNSIDRILTVAKSEQTRLVIEKVTISLKSYLEELTAAFIKNNIHVKNITIDVTCVPEDITAPFDLVKMNNVFNNLMDNAVKYSYNEVHITINAWKKGKKIHISVLDNGMGIPANDLDDIFDNFTQGDLLERKRMFGYGIGLSFIKKVIEAHGGEITASSKVQEGSLFTIVLPEY